MNTSEQTYNP